MNGIIQSEQQKFEKTLQNSKSQLFNAEAAIAEYENDIRNNIVRFKTQTEFW